MRHNYAHVALAAVALLATPADGQGFSTSPMSAPPAMPRDSLPATPLGFLDWLRTRNPATFTGREQLIREHLYALIAQLVKQRFASTQTTEPAKGDSGTRAVIRMGRQVRCSRR